MGVFRSVVGILFILGGIYRVLLGLGFLFFGSVIQSFDPVGDVFMEVEGGGVIRSDLLSLIGLGYIILGGIFIWLGNVIRNSGQKIIRI